MKNTKSKIKPIKIGKQCGTTYCFGCKDYMKNFRPQEVKLTNKVLREIKIFKTKNKLTINVTCLSNTSCKQRIKTKMKIYCVKCRRDAENIDPKMVRTKSNRLVMQSKCSACGIKKSRFVKEQEAKGLLSNLGIKTPLSKIPLLNVLF